MTLTDFPALVERLSGAGVEFVIVGGVAATLHGSAHITYDLDVVYRRSRETIEKLAGALAPIRPYLRGAPPGLPFVLDAQTLSRGLNFRLTTEIGDLDLLGEVAGGGTYETLVAEAEAGSSKGREFRYVSLRRLILLKRAAGRAKDFNMLAELEALLEEHDRDR